MSSAVLLRGSVPLLLRALLLALFTAGTVGAGLASVAYLSGAWGYPVMIVAWVVSLLLALGVARLAEPGTVRSALLLVAWAVTGPFLLTSWSTGFAHSMLEWRGEQVEATVLALRISPGRSIQGPNAHYTLAGPDGRRIPGEWSAPGHSRLDPGDYASVEEYWAADEKAARSARPGLPYNGTVPDHPVGSRVTVVRDRAGLVYPATPDEIADAEGFRILGGLALFVGALFCIFAVPPVGAEH
ncbi:hypothetical protein [Krasilnikovia sp. MM14-A1004]|uniref:hypothetical protein n=1 Tax=Krasilnikovia sp. MM14-A1004 TaxID=3373541 RepID=UPI00399D04EF